MIKSKCQKIVVTSISILLSITSCRKIENLASTNPASEGNNARTIITGTVINNPPPPPIDLYDGFHAFNTGIGANPGGDDTHTGIALKKISFTSYNPVNSWTQGLDLTLWGLVGSPNATDMKCYGEYQNYKAIAYMAVTGPIVPTLLYSDGSTTGTFINPITYNLSPLTLDEIEINPTNLKVYAIASNGSNKSLFVIEPTTGIATLVNYQLSDGVTLSPAIFNHYALNGYKSGSIAFVQNNSADPSQGYHLSYTNESSIYASQGVLVWNFLLNTLAGNPTIISANAIFPNTSYNNLPNPQTGNINTVSLYGNLYFARDNGALFQLNTTNNNITAIGTGNINAANDFGPKQ